MQHELLMLFFPIFMRWRSVIANDRLDHRVAIILTGADMVKMRPGQEIESAPQGFDITAVP